MAHLLYDFLGILLKKYMTELGLSSEEVLMKYNSKKTTLSCTLVRLPQQYGQIEKPALLLFDARSTEKRDEGKGVAGLLILSDIPKSGSPISELAIVGGIYVKCISYGYVKDTKHMKFSLRLRMIPMEGRVEFCSKARISSIAYFFDLGKRVADLFASSDYQWINQYANIDGEVVPLQSNEITCEHTL